MNICVYGASSQAIDKKYISAVEKLGEEMALRNHSLVFGGPEKRKKGIFHRDFENHGISRFIFHVFY